MAGKIQIPAGLTVVNTDLYLFSLKEDKDVRMELLLPGRPWLYRCQPARDAGGMTLNLIPVDSIFSPVAKVTFDVEEQRVGQRTDYDKLVDEGGHQRLDQAGDGDDPAAELLIKHLEFLKSFSEPQEEKPTASDLRKNRLKELFNRSVEELELSVRSSNCLKACEHQDPRRAGAEIRKRDDQVP